MSVKPWNAGPRNVLTGKALTGLTLYLFLAAGSRLSRQQAYRIIRDAGIEAGTVTQTHPHMLRHACGYELAERGADTRLIQDYLGHRNIRHTVRYTASNAARFAGLWERNNLINEKLKEKRFDLTY